MCELVEIVRACFYMGWRFCRLSGKVLGDNCIGLFTLLEHCHNTPWSIVPTQGKMADFVYTADTMLHGALCQGARLM